MITLGSEDATGRAEGLVTKNRSFGWMVLTKSSLMTLMFRKAVYAAISTYALWRMPFQLH